MRWPWIKRDPHEEQRRRWYKAYGGYAPFPPEPMTPEQAKEYLTKREPCGCVSNWWASPPSGFTCLDRAHIGGHGAPPTYFLYARAVLDGGMP